MGRRGTKRSLGWPFVGIRRANCQLTDSVEHRLPVRKVGSSIPGLWKVHIKDPLLLIGKSSLCGNSGVPHNDHMLDV